MSVLVVGLSHKGAPLATLERVSLTGDALDKLLHDVARADDVAGALVLSTCNRVEIYAEVGKFHGAVAAICELLSRHSNVPIAELTPCLYVHYEDRAIQHLLAVACGLDSVVIGESQILGQLRQALHVARQQGTLGRSLSELGSLALRAGKRTHTETKVGAAGASLVSVGLEAAARHFGDGPADVAALAGRRVLVVGAGSMSGLDGRERHQGRRRRADGHEPDEAPGRATRCVGWRPGRRHVRPCRLDRGRGSGRDVHRSLRPRRHGRHGDGGAGTASAAAGTFFGGPGACWTLRCRATSTRT